MLNTPTKPTPEELSAALYELRAYCGRVHELVSRAGYLRVGLQCVLAQHEVDVAIEVFNGFTSGGSPCGGPPALLASLSVPKPPTSANVRADGSDREAERISTEQTGQITFHNSNPNATPEAMATAHPFPKGRW